MDAENTSESLWRETKQVCGYELPPPASWFLRLPFIRNIRAAILAWKIETHYGHWPGGLRTGYDEWVLYAVYRGWC